MRITLLMLTVLLVPVGVSAQSDLTPRGAKGFGLSLSGMRADGGHYGAGAAFSGFSGGLAEGTAAYTSRGSHGNHTVSAATFTLGITPFRLASGYAVGPKLYVQGSAGLTNSADYGAVGGALVGSLAVGSTQRLELEAHLLHVGVSGGSTDTVGGVEVSWLFKQTERVGMTAAGGLSGGLGDKRLVIALGVFFLTPDM